MRIFFRQSGGFLCFLLTFFFSSKKEPFVPPYSSYSSSSFYLPLMHLLRKYSEIETEFVFVTSDLARFPSKSHLILHFFSLEKWIKIHYVTEKFSWHWRASQIKFELSTLLRRGSCVLLGVFNVLHNTLCKGLKKHPSYLHRWYPSLPQDGSACCRAGWLRRPLCRSAHTAPPKVRTQRRDGARRLWSPRCRPKRTLARWRCTRRRRGWRPTTEVEQLWRCLGVHGQKSFRKVV